jgi:hypothetical protein
LILPAISEALVESIIIRYNDNYIEIDYLLGDSYSIKYEEIIKVWRGRGKQISNIYISFNNKSSNNKEISIKFSFRCNTRNGKKIIKKLKEKGIDIL